ncbi:MAG: GxxExxY protein [Candidatus Levybacteria bacterium]|nr:GxxExxY protein [Candidatus Levybacteria bacterium]
MARLIYKELSYQLMGVLFEVHNKLGGGFEEKYYQRAVEKRLRDLGIKYSKELKADLFFDDG